MSVEYLYGRCSKSLLEANEQRLGKITHFTLIDINFKQKRNKYKNAHKMSVVYFKGGVLYTFI